MTLAGRRRQMLDPGRTCSCTKTVVRMLVVAAAGAVVSCQVSHGAPASREAPVPSESRAAPASAAPAASDRAPGPRWSLLGRLVDLGRFEVVQTLVDPPEEELNLPASDLVVVRTRNGRLGAFRLSTGARLWQQTPDAPCRGLLVAGTSVYAGCADKVVARAIETGQATVIDAGPQALDPVLAGDAIAVAHDDGHLDLYDLATGQRRGARVIREFARASVMRVLANPSGEGVCVLGFWPLSPRRAAYRAGCYDARLAPRWTRTVSMMLPRDAIYDVRQLGPRFLVLDDQYSPYDPERSPGIGRGVLLRWRDGQITPFDDQIFATLDDASGERLPASSDDVFHRARELAGDHPSAGVREAQVAGDDKQTFVLIQNGGVALAAVDRAGNRTRFLVAVPAAHAPKLEIAAGMPVIRSHLDDRWLVTVHDPATGKLLFQDARDARAVAAAAP